LAEVKTIKSDIEGGSFMNMKMGMLLMLAFLFILSFSGCSNDNYDTHDSLSQIDENSGIWVIRNWHSENEVLPLNFRTVLDRLNQEGNEQLPSVEGLKDIKGSGSAQFGDNGLAEIIKRINYPEITVIDLRQESHGLANGNAISWFTGYNQINWNKQLHEIMTEEKLLLDNLLKEQTAKIYELSKPTDLEEMKTGINPIEMKVNSISTEEELCNRLKVGYMRIPVPDYQRPADRQVDVFIEYAQMYSKKAWFHFHCHQGEGRTTTFLSMLDMMSNSSKVSFDDIIKRQYLIGGSNLFDTSNRSRWHVNQIIKRTEFLDMFYEYCRENAPDFKQKWSEWLKRGCQGDS